MKTTGLFIILLLALWMLVGVPVFASIPIDKKVTVQPILVVGSMSDPNWFEAETDKIWAQAGIDVRFLPLTFYENPVYIGIESMEELENFFAEAGGRSDDPTVINIWFTGHLPSDIFGYTNGIGNNMIVIAESVVDGHQVSLLAHELGHALGLDHLDVPWDPISDYLMSSVSMGTTSIDDIYPDGLQYEKLTVEEIALARTSSYAKLINPYKVTRSVIGNGGGTSAGGQYAVMGTVGQFDAGYHEQPPYELLGGFWVGGPLCIVNLEHFATFASHWLDGPCNESNDWCGGADLDQLGDVTVVDLSIFTNYWLNVCPFSWPL